MNNLIINQIKGQDFSLKKSKKHDYKMYKLNALSVSDSFKRLGDVSRAARMRHCGDALLFQRLKDGGLQLISADFCRERLCPACAVRRSMKTFAQVSKVMNALDAFSYRYIFLTLTIPNCSAAELPERVQFILQRFHNFIRRKQIKAAVMGGFRALEVTYNKARGSFHPHIHCVLAVPPQYFHDARLYLSQSDFVKIWRSCCGFDFDPVVDVRTFRESRGGAGREVAEVAKYAVKASDLVARDDGGEIDTELSDYLVGAFHRALRGRRLTAFFGIFKKIHKDLRLSDVESEIVDLVNIDDEIIRPDLAAQIELYRWRIGADGLNYYRSEL